MAQRTSYLNLILPGNDEYRDTWDEPVNHNWEALEEWASEFGTEVEEARGTQASLKEFLLVGHDTDGSLKPSPEVERSRNSKLYGDEVDDNDFQLYDVMEQADFEMLHGREGAEDLRASFAQHSNDFYHRNTVISGPKTAEGYPNFLTASGVSFRLDAQEDIVMNIEGFRLRVREDTDVACSGSAGYRFLVSKKPSTAPVVLDRSTQQAGALTTNGDNEDKLQIFSDSTQNFSTANVKPGDVLEILNTDSAGKYIIDSIAPNADVTKFIIKGLFPATASGINYKVYDALEPELSVEEVYLEEDGKCIIGEGYWDGSALTSAVAYAFKGIYESQWKQIDATAGGGFYNEIFSHNLGRPPRKITVFASQHNDHTDPTRYVEQLSTAEVNNQLNVQINNSLAYTPGSLTYVDVDSPQDTLSYTPGSLAGGVTGGLTGQIQNSRSVRAKFTRLQATLKNPTQNLFYIDFDGVSRTNGYLKIICER